MAKAELPGLKKEEIEVGLEEGDLVIKGEHGEDRLRMQRDC